MAGRFQVQAARLPQGQIRPTEVAPKGVSFSFRHLHADHPTFGLRDGEGNARQGEYFAKLLARLKDVCLMTAAELRISRSKALRSHSITWSETSQPRGFSHLPSHLQQEQPWQFSITANEHGRVHGFFIGDVFYIVWLDAGHDVYSS